MIVSEKTDGMRDATELVTNLFKNHNIQVPAGRKQLLTQFLQDEENLGAIKSIIQNQDQLMAKWKLENRIADIKQQPVRVLNGTVGKPYESRFDPEQLNWKDLIDFSFKGLEELGLRYDAKTRQIMGVPTLSGDHKVVFRFKLTDEPADRPLNEKIIPLIINPDPRSLWKTVASDKSDP